MVASDSAQRVKTGIPGLDDLMGGGLLPSRASLVTGTAGSGKTILASQFAYMGAKKYKEPTVYLSFEESPEIIRMDCMNFGWDFGPLEKEGTFSFVKYDPYHVDEIPNTLMGKVREISAKRVVIDSLSSLSFYGRDDAEFRRLVFNISLVLQKMKCTSMLVSEIVPGTLGLSRSGIEEFIVDGVIVLYYKRVNSAFSRAIQVWKMRGTKHSEKLHPYKIGNNGIEVYPKEEAFMGVE